MSRIIFIGKTGCGKTTLCQKLDELDINYKKTQSVEIYKNSIDTPGEYLENRGLYNALIVTAVDADVIALVYDPKVEEGYFAPGFASMFCKKVIGIITKINQVDEEKIAIAEERIMLAGATEVFKVDTVDNIGVGRLKQYLEEI